MTGILACFRPSAGLLPHEGGGEGAQESPDCGLDPSTSLKRSHAGADAAPAPASSGHKKQQKLKPTADLPVLGEPKGCSRWGAWPGHSLVDSASDILCAFLTHQPALPYAPTREPSNRGVKMHGAALGAARGQRAGWKPVARCITDGALHA